MRRKDRQKDEKFALKIIDEAEYATISLSYENRPYALPISIAREENCLYFHGAKAGRKHDIIGDGKFSVLTFVGRVEVPEIFTEEELENIVKENKINLLGSKVFTTEYESAIVEGQIVRLIDDQEKINGLRALCRKYTPEKMKYFEYAIKASLKFTEVYRIDMLEISAKSKKL